ncbi:putative ATP-dependent helicase [Kineosphaera limosa NBRC 100340]|uniref:Putative ATP-dependent helicase n=1 Tax=Kineosphaera limosa NBRC 100340 TaxID=1184609 RepID=K6X5S0_9MICO|nr:putative ATP-dependent helicase [Kineosphaera limosa NBRC 100340]
MLGETGPVVFDVARIGHGLPFAVSLPALREALAEVGSAAIVQAPPGTGKTTLVPPLVAELVAAWGPNGMPSSGAATPGAGGAAGGSGPAGRRTGRVVVTQPRRIAVRAAAARLAQLDGSGVGERVGFTVRGERRMSRATVVEFCTPGVLLRRLLADPELPGVAAVVLDEVHERGLETDLLVGMLAQVRQLREDLRLVAMSATLDAPRFAALLGDGEPVPIVDCPAALHPLQVLWRPPPDGRFDARGVTRGFLDHASSVTREALRAHPEADALVFLPGAWEVGRVAATLRAALPAPSDGDRAGGDPVAGIEVLELHGRLPPREQDRVVRGRRPGEPRRVVVSTAVAESSLTVPGVRLVVDAGLSREPRRDAARGMSGLVTVAASRDAATQRAGRAARLGPGTVVRCYDEQTYARMPAHVTPQIAAADLTEAALLLACWGTPGGVGLPLPDPPPAAALADAHAVLRGLEALEADGRASAAGRELAALPVDPRLGRALLAGSRAVGARRAAEVVAALADDHRPEGADLPGLLVRLRSGHAPGHATWQSQRRRLETLATGQHSEAPAGSGSPEVTGAAGGRSAHRTAAPMGHRSADEVAGLVVALAFPDRIARLDGGVYLLAGGTRAALPPASALRGSEWIAVADVGRSDAAAASGTGALIRLAAPLTEQDALAAGSALHTKVASATWRDGRVTARRVEALGAIELAATPIKPTPELGRAAVTRALRTEGLSLLSWSEAAEGLRRRLAFLRHHLREPWPDVRDDALLAELEVWLGPELARLAEGTRAERLDLHEALRRLLPWADGSAGRLDDLAPARLPVPSGRTAAITYPTVDRADERPVVAVKLQECFGLADTPRLADGRVPVLFHLLSPAGRPLAVTDDLASFWSGPYQQVRAEMRGRYPKHPWPVDPWTAPATARTTRRVGR